MAEQGGANLYAFVANSPVNFADPLGLCVTMGSPAGGQENGKWKWYDWVDVLAAWAARNHAEKTEGWLDMSGDGITSWFDSGLSMTFEDFIAAALMTPYKLEHLGDGTGTWEGNPSWKTF